MVAMRFEEEFANITSQPDVNLEKAKKQLKENVIICLRRNLSSRDYIKRTWQKALNLDKKILVGLIYKD
jgi:hypothetical protein